ncbi:MAG: DUF3726 domain-containing protein [Polaromonas sp.]
MMQATTPAHDDPARPGQAVPLRSPDTVMRLARMGSFHPSRLSFMHALLRRMEREAWRFERPLWEIDARGVGRAVYCVHGPQRSYSLVAFAHDLPEAMRSDRVIATAWDATFTLFDGVPCADDLERLQANVPRQEAGRIAETELTLARANRSTRLWEHVIGRLAQGEQPDAAQVSATGYLMRTTAVYGSGKFGAADRQAISGREELRAPFRAEMLTVWLIRAFTLDLVEHMARLRGGERAVALEPGLRRSLGVGNSTGLGMAPFLLNHPVLLDRWMLARETALARVRTLAQASAAALQAFAAALARARSNAAQWLSEHPVQQRRVAALRADLQRLQDFSEQGALAGAQPWNRLFLWAESALSLEGQEQLVSLMLEPYPELVDDLAEAMDADEQAPFTIDGAMTVAQLRGLLETNFQWATGIDFSDRAACARFWYVSEEKLEPRLGERHSDPGAERELPLCTADHIQAMLRDLKGWQDEASVAAFLLARPQHRHAMRRVQISRTHRYAEVRDNLIAQDMLPIDLLRCKLSFFGATRFDPRSDRWVRISMYQDAPFPHELCPPALPAAHRPGAGAALPAAAAPAGTVRYSLSEIEAQSRKAARGAGLPWGLADEAGKAARWLAGFGLAGPALLAGLLTRNDGKPFDALCPTGPAQQWQAQGGELCPLIAGASLLDRAGTLAGQTPLSLGAIAYPVLLLPFLARALDQDADGFEVSWNGITVCCQRAGLTVHGDEHQLQTAHVDSLSIRRSAPASAPQRTPSAASQAVAVRDWAALEGFAYRTLVPASDSSRAGAGSSTPDND